MKNIKHLVLASISLLTSAAAQAQLPCDTVTGKICRSIVVDTAYNPYVTGVLGNWRANRSYTWYGERAETNPQSSTDIRRNGAFADFSAFWQFSNQQLVSQPDTNKWKWNSEITLMNRKGFEIENKDPLGRYNAGLYGYNLTMPTAVVQNSRYRESMYEGFEDYDFVTQICDTGCFADRHFDYSPYKSKIDQTQKHTGKSSIRLNKDEQIGVSCNLIMLAEDEVQPDLRFNLVNNNCVTGGKALSAIKSTQNILLPVFSPVRGDTMVISGWVKEDRDCACSTYDGARIRVAFSSGSVSAFNLRASGNIIEGWQRFETLFVVPNGSRLMTVEFRADSATTWFDDLRIHPYHANMKSFVYHPVNLRLMAELDENNYATLYEYDDDGTLVRLKKETERGIKTIRETRSALLKE